MKEEYKGFTIKYSENADCFSFATGEVFSGYGNKSLAKVKEYIDKLLKPKFTRTTVILKSNPLFSDNAKYRNADVTSEVFAGNYRKEKGIECWVVFEDKSRSKLSSGSLLHNCDANLKLIEEIKKLCLEITNTQKQIKDIEKDFIPYETQLNLKDFTDEK